MKTCLVYNYVDIYYSLLEVNIFGPIRFLYKKKVTKSIFLKNKPKPVQTGRFRFGLVF